MIWTRCKSVDRRHLQTLAGGVVFASSPARDLSRRQARGKDSAHFRAADRVDAWMLALQAVYFDQGCAAVAHHTLRAWVCVETSTRATVCTPMAREIDTGGKTLTAISTWITTELGYPKLIFQTERVNLLK